MSKIAVYPGSFDPMTIGHLEIIQKASKLFDKVYVILCINKSKSASLFTLEERLEMLKIITKDIPNVEVDVHYGLAMDYATKVNANALVKGVRNAKDFDYEITQYHFNHQINSKVETVVFLPDVSSLYISSSAVRELMSFHAEYSQYVPKEILKFLKEKEKTM
ncbi:MAG: pantetheine-phosphate adenylyltransferase [Bacilli bacterium]|nr:pantetheine-phosphate adenylyltransferase [Bacilli bacterium]